MNQDIKNILKNMTSRPGIYKFMDKESNIIYIGKALNLSKRVVSYFNKSSASIKTSKLVEKIANIQTIIIVSSGNNSRVFVP